MLEQYAGSSAVNMTRGLGNVTAWLSRSQFVCVAEQLTSALDAYDPQALQDHVDTILDLVPSEILLYLSEQYICQTFARSCARYLEKMAGAPFELLPRSSLIRECVRDTAIGCLNKPVSELSQEDLSVLGGIVCEFTGHNVSELQDSTFGASVSQFGKCAQFHATAPTVLAAKITTSLGSATLLGARWWDGGGERPSIPNEPGYPLGVGAQPSIPNEPGYPLGVGAQPSIPNDPGYPSVLEPSRAFLMSPATPRCWSPAEHS
ncbi:uncharacterized protein [Chiloscyllium punctatum]|uniref:uncharacterized protein n=1 Tax=Chiloscyllium punctatum TaxID=137246 RepID=UPI003B639C26